LGGSSYGTLLSVKYLLIQRVAGLLILGALVISIFNRSAGLAGPVVSLMLLLKLGGFPFFHWLVLIGEKLGWLPLYLILTLQKLIPLFVLSHVPSPLIFRLSVISWVAIPAIGLLSKTLKKIVILSSLFNLIIITATLEISRRKWKALLLIYVLITCPLITLGEMAACSRWKAVGSMSKLTRLGLMMFFFVRIGLPPLPRFFMKVEVILAVITANSAFGAIFLGAGAAGMLILYLGLVVGASLSGPRILMRLHFTPKAPLYLSPIFLAGGLLL